MQNVERVLISALTPLCGNTARGGLHHQPLMRSMTLASTSPLKVSFKPRKDDAASVFDSQDVNTKQRIAGINKAVERHLIDARQLWNKRTSGGISAAAFENTVKWAKVSELASEGVLNVRIAKDITREAFNDVVKDSGFFGQHCGPGPKLPRLAVTTIAGGAHPRLVMGPFIDLWVFSLEHDDLILAIVTLCRILMIWSPLVIVSQSAQASTLLQFEDFAKVRTDVSLEAAVAAATVAEDTSATNTRDATNATNVISGA